ncbi:MAG: adenylate/guanylate cyclase domain-containing protein [Acidimicrobiales bacterium]
MPNHASEPKPSVGQSPAFGTGKLLSGTVALMFSEMEGSTAQRRRLGEESFAQVSANHSHLIRSALRAHEGTEVDTQRDGLFAVFPSPGACAATAIEIQRSLASDEWRERVRVRMGIHAGEAQSMASGLAGLDINKAARVAAAAHGGQVLLSQSGAALLRGVLPEGTSLRDLGGHRLKDLGRPEQIFQLDIKGLEDEFPPIRSLDNPELENNLPAQPSSFVGREKEVSDVSALVETSRLVTLTGAGGSGKTRLALQVAAELLDGSGEGVWFVELADISDPDLVASAVSRTLGIKELPGHGIQDSLLSALADLRLLILLDNCEHVITSCAKLADAIVRRCPQVHLIATSREPLGIDGETVWPVATLSLPPDSPEELAEVASSGAVALFLDRARSQIPGFSLNEENAPLISSVCRRLDGMPLAIELAVARLRSLSLADLNNRLDRRFQLLTGGSRSALPRHQTLRGVVDWSYDMLTEPERVLLRRLSVFSGGFELDAAENVCGFGALEEFDVTVLLGGLVDRSLVVADASSLAIRYRLLETIRQYAAERLADVDEDETLRLFNDHAHFYLSFAESAAPQLTGPDQGVLFVRLETEYPNLFGALTNLSEGANQSEPALRLAVALRHFWHCGGATRGEIPLLDRILEQPGSEIPDSLSAAAVLCRADLLRSIDLPASAQSADDALKLARRCGDPKLIADALSFRSYTSLWLGDIDEAVSLANEAIAFGRECGDPVLLRSSLDSLARAVGESDPPLAERLYAESITLAERSGNWSGLLASHNNLGLLLINLGQLDQARIHLESALVAASKGVTNADADNVLGSLGFLLLREGNTSGAANNFVRYLRSARRSGQVRMRFYAELGLACCATRNGDPAKGATLHGIAQASLDAYGGDWEPDDQRIRDADLVELRQTLGASFDHWYETGQAMGHDEAYAFALNL